MPALVTSVGWSVDHLGDETVVSLCEETFEYRVIVDSATHLGRYRMMDLASRFPVWGVKFSGFTPEPPSRVVAASSPVKRAKSAIR